MDDEAGVKVAGEDLRDDFVEGDGNGLELWIEDFECEVGGGEGAGDSYFDFAQVFRGDWLAGDDHGAVSLADAAAATHERVALLEVGIGVKADGGDVEEGFVLGAAVQGLDIAEGMSEAIAGHAHLIGGEAIKHEGVIGVGAMGDGYVDDAGWSCDVGLLGGH